MYIIQYPQNPNAKLVATIRKTIFASFLDRNFMTTPIETLSP
jgi:hypothetical protein